MVKKTIVFILLTLMLSTSFSVPLSVSAAFDCLTLTVSSSQSDKDFCKNELSQIEAQLTELLNKQKEQQKQTGTIKGDINYLTTQINALKTKVKARALKIAELKIDIKEKVSKIETLSEKIKREHESLAQLLRNTNDLDNRDFIYLVFSDESLFTFYSDIESFSSIKEAVKESVEQIRGIKTETETEKKDLEKKQNAETDAKVELETAQKKVVQSEREKKQLLALSKDKEASYQKLAAEKKARADKIRRALFSLRDSEPIPFGVALQYAEEAQQKTGIRPALVLAILEQESSSGLNVGSCLITNLQTGETKSVKSETIFSNGIHPTRDLPLLQKIVEGLGRNPFTTKVSCPLASGGYGGAMGPTQFIPSTWNIFASQIERDLNKETADPWDPKDAIFATSIFLKDLGAGTGGYTAERTAALKYFAGGNWKLKKNAFYGNSVMSLVTKIQAKIDELSNS